MRDEVVVETPALLRRSWARGGLADRTKTSIWRGLVEPRRRRRLSSMKTPCVLAKEARHELREVVEYGAALLAWRGVLGRLAAGERLQTRRSGKRSHWQPRSSPEPRGFTKAVSEDEGPLSDMKC